MDKQEAREINLPIVFFIIQIIIIAILIALIILTKKDDKVVDTDYDRRLAVKIDKIESILPEAEPTYLGLIERDLAEIVEMNSTSFNFGEAKAEIRDESLSTQSFNNIEGTFFSMIVDLPSLQQSYQIYSHYPIKNSEPGDLSYDTRYILCLNDKTKIIYQNFKCKSIYPFEKRYDIADTYLKFFDFNYFAPVIDEKDPSRIIISPMMDNPSSTEKAEYVKQTQSAIESLGISPGIFEYYVMNPEDYTYYYDGG